MREFFRRNGEELSMGETKKKIREKSEKRAQLLEQGLDKYAPQLLEEIRGIADGSGQSYEDLLFLNAAGEAGGCSAWAAIGNATKDHHGYLGFHADWCLSALPQMVVVRADPSGGHSFTCLTFAGCVGPTGGGLNDKGLACVYTTVETEDTGPGVNPAILIKLALQHEESVEGAINVVGDHTTYYGSNLVAVDRSEAIVIEKTCSHTHVRRASAHDWGHVDGDGVLAVPSHFTSSEEMNKLSPSMPQYPSSYYRYIRLCQLLYQNKGSIDLEVMRQIDRDHYDVSLGRAHPSPNTICRHDIPDTIWSTLFDTTAVELWVAEGHPCEGHYSTYKVTSGFTGE